MGSFRDSLLKTIESIRGNIPGNLDLRQHKVTIRQVRWTGARSGLGTKTTTDIPLYNAGRNVKVVEISSKDIVESAGIYQAGDYRIGPLTPSHSGGGLTANTVSPPYESTPLEIYYKVEGPGFPDECWFKKVEDQTVRNFTNTIVIRRIGTKPP